MLWGYPAALSPLYSGRSAAARTAENEVEFFARNMIPLGLTALGGGQDIEKKGEEQCLD